MRDIYKKLGFLDSVLDGEAVHYSENPEGELDINRLISSQPAFRSLATNESFKQKKLLLGPVRAAQILPA